MATKKIPTARNGEEAEESQSRMSFGEHLEELRRRIFLALYGGIAGIVLCLGFMYRIFDWVARPYRIVAHAHHAPDLFMTLKPQEAFFTYVTLALEAGLVLTSPWIINQLWRFVAAGLYQRERKIVYRYVGPSALLFLLGVAFFYFIVLPMTLNFFFSFTAHSAGPPPRVTWLEGKLLGLGGTPAPTGAPATTAATGTASAPAQTSPSDTEPNIPVVADDPPAPPKGQAILYYNSSEAVFKIRTSEETAVLQVAPEGSYFTNVWRASDYLSFVAFTALIFGLAFEMPMVIVILAQIDMVQVKTFRGIRKYAYFGILCAAVFAAPSGDIMTLAFLFLPLVALYEVGIVAAGFVTRGRE